MAKRRIFELMTTDNIELLAAYFTIAGDIYPLGPTEISPFPFRDRVEAAARAGYRGIGLHHADTMHTASQIGLPEMRRILDANGIKYVELEFLLNWFEEGERRRESDKMRSDIFSVAAALGLRMIKVGPGFHEPEANIPKMRDAFAQLCREAAEHGTGIMLEIMPWSNVRTVETARAIVEGAAQPNGGILADIWHFARGGIDYNDVAQIPLQYLAGVELDDAAKQVVGSLWEDTIHHRRLCGEGDLNPPAFIEAVQAAGYRGYYGVELLSEEHRKLPLEEMARRSFETTMEQFKKLAPQSGEGRADKS
jgi:sugar phosphate isomerase/epimerase